LANYKANDFNTILPVKVAQGTRNQMTKVKSTANVFQSFRRLPFVITTNHSLCRSRTNSPCCSRRFSSEQSLYKLYDHLGTIFQDQDFTTLFSDRGQPGQAPFRIALVTILQFIEGLSDRSAVDAVRGRIDWKYLLCPELDDPGFDHSVLCEFRARLLEGGAERILFDKILSALRDKKLVKPRTAGAN
jgi:transposase